MRYTSLYSQYVLNEPIVQARKQSKSKNLPDYKSFYSIQKWLLRIQLCQVHLINELEAVLQRISM
jgi:16S rRNA U1498 N3-methylase RsmE